MSISLSMEISECMYVLMSVTHEYIYQPQRARACSEFEY